MDRKQKLSRPYVIALVACFCVAFSPTVFNFVVDPFNMNRIFQLGFDKPEISVKAHYPLYKMVQYPRSKAKTIVLGDSRARALQDRYFQELGYNDVYNFAYGGATVYEIYDTFRYLTENAEIEKLVIGLPFRSMDARHKGGLNRVPEAIKMAGNPIAYYTSWFVSRTGWTLVEEQYPGATRMLRALMPSFVGTAEAYEFQRPGDISLEALLDPEICAGCDLPAAKPLISLPTSYRHSGYGIGKWSRIWPKIELDRDLPRNFAKQVGTNGAADWRRFEQSNDLWKKLEIIADWSRRNGVTLVFVVPPTIPEMQRRIDDFGLTAANHRFRERLSDLAPVVDLDFDNGFTRTLTHFTDAYHFNAQVARAIVGEIVQLIDAGSASAALAKSRRKDVVCPAKKADATRELSDVGVQMREGRSCRIWRKNDV